MEQCLIVVIEEGQSKMTNMKDGGGGGESKNGNGNEYVVKWGQQR